MTVPSPELKRLAGVAATGRKLEKPVCHYSLNWAKDEKPDRQEMSRAAEESLKSLGMERNQALIVSHRDGQPHVHVIANRVDPESGIPKYPLLVGSGSTFDTSIPSLNFTPMITLSRSLNPRSRRQRFSAHWPSLNIRVLVLELLREEDLEAMSRKYGVTEARTACGAR